MPEYPAVGSKWKESELVIRVALPPGTVVGDITSAIGTIGEAATAYIDWYKLYNKEPEPVSPSGMILFALIAALKDHSIDLADNLVSMPDLPDGEKKQIMLIPFGHEALPQSVFNAELVIVENSPGNWDLRKDRNLGHKLVIAESS